MYRQNAHSHRPFDRRGKSRFSRGTPMGLNPALLVKKATGTEVSTYVSTNTFANFALCDELKRNVIAHGYITPTPIQDQAIGPILEGRDVVGIASTGTGKTAAFLLPLIQKIWADRTQKVLIVAPTRELAVQIDDEFWGFAKGMRIGSVLVIGGASMSRQVNELRRNPNVVIGTPGRLRDLEKQGVIRFGDFNTIVLDEVDRMLDMGFVVSIRHIISQLPAKRHSLFFSATVPDAIKGIMNQFLTNPVTIAIKAQAPSELVNQDIIRMNGKPKIEILHELLVQAEFSKVLLFGKTKWGIEKLFVALQERGFKVAAIHGNKRQSQRQRALDAFKQSEIQILLATDVASRGIDVSDITHVINYDMPESYEDYIHRIGRTGRANKIGNALTFVD